MFLLADILILCDIEVVRIHLSELKSCPFAHLPLHLLLHWLLNWRLHVLLHLRGILATALIYLIRQIFFYIPDVLAGTSH